MFVQSVSSASPELATSESSRALEHVRTSLRSLQRSLASVSELGARATAQVVRRSELAAALEQVRSDLARYHDDLEQVSQSRARASRLAGVLRRHLQWSAERQRRSVLRLARAAQRGAAMSALLQASWATALALGVEAEQLAHDVRTVSAA